MWAVASEELQYTGDQKLKSVSFNKTLYGK